MSLSVYDYQSPRRFLVESFAERNQTEKAFSVRQWAKEMEMSHTLLLMLMQGKRPIRLKHFPSLAKGLALSTPERLYYQALIEFDAATSVEQKNLLQIWLTELHPGGERKNLELETFKMIADWIHCGILAHCMAKPVENQPHVIAKRFGNKVDANQVRLAIERLLEMKLLEKDAQGRLLATHHNYSTKNDVADRGAKEYHRQVSDLAKQAVVEQPVSDREFQSFALPIDPSKVELAKELIRRFRYQFCEAMGSPEGDHEVFQMNLQFFRLTESPLEKSRAADEGAGSTPSTPQESSHVYS